MTIFHTAGQLRSHLKKYQINGKSTGFVPTMGALHKGHISLIEQSKTKADISVCSIFVNPTQFNNKDDFEKYPNTIQNDIGLLIQSECDVLFLPSVQEIYPGGTGSIVPYDLGFLETVLEGFYRPGHFQGVCRVMDRLLTIIQPQLLLMGLKDYQQCMVVRRLIELKQWRQQIQFHACPTLRESDGLAMSSRNMRLTTEERAKGAAIFEVLSMLKKSLQPGSLVPLKEKAIAQLVNNGFSIDYVEIVDALTLELINEWDGQKKITALVAALIGNVRLIDNMILN